MAFTHNLVVGHTERFGHYVVTRDEVIAFATAYDPQPFHLDDTAAAATHFGKIAASGWHTTAMTMRMMVDHWNTNGIATLGSPGVDDIRWLKPVYPGDTLSVSTELLEVRQSASRPGLGLTKTRITTSNDRGDPVMRFIANGMFAMHDAADNAPE